MGIKNVQGYGAGRFDGARSDRGAAKLNAAQRAKLEEFAKLCDENVHPMSKGFLDKAKTLFS